MELEPRPEQPPATPLADAERQAAADRLVDAAGTARLTLSEFSERVVTLMGDVEVYSGSSRPLRRKGWSRWFGHAGPDRKEIPE
jgi:hypothetical protein